MKSAQISKKVPLSIKKCHAIRFVVSAQIAMEKILVKNRQKHEITL